MNKQELLKTISEKVENLYKQLNEGKGYNPYRDAKGRFASGPSAAFGEYYAFGRGSDISISESAQYSEFGENTLPGGDTFNSPFNTKGTKAYIEASASLSSSKTQFEQPTPKTAKEKSLMDTAHKIGTSIDSHGQSIISKTNPDREITVKDYDALIATQKKVEALKSRAKKIYEDATSSNIDSKVKQYVEAVTAMSMTMSDTITKIDPNGYFAPYEISYQDLDF